MLKFGLLSSALVALALALPVEATAGEYGDYCGCEGKAYVPCEQPCPKPHRLCAPAPRDLPIYESVAIRRVEARLQSRYRFEQIQESGELPPRQEAAEKKCDSSQQLLGLLTQTSRVDELAQRVGELDQRMNLLLEKIEQQQELIGALARHLKGDDE